MSEFSESFHLRSESQADGEGLLRRAGLTGAVINVVGLFLWMTVYG